MDDDVGRYMGAEHGCPVQAGLADWDTLRGDGNEVLRSGYASQWKALQGRLSGVRATRSGAASTWVGLQQACAGVLGPLAQHPRGP